MNSFPASPARAALRAGLQMLVVAVSVEPLGAAEERSATLEAIRMIENPRNLTRPGPRGELGPFQFRVETWRMHTTRPFAMAIQPDIAREVAERHHDWIRRGLARAGLPGDTYHVALAWNSGLQAVLAGRAPRRAHQYAQRAANLAVSLRADRAYAAVAPPGRNSREEAAAAAR